MVSVSKDEKAEGNNADGDYAHLDLNPRVGSDGSAFERGESGGEQRVRGDGDYYDHPAMHTEVDSYGFGFKRGGAQRVTSDCDNAHHDLNTGVGSDGFDFERGGEQCVRGDGDYAHLGMNTGVGSDGFGFETGEGVGEPC